MESLQFAELTVGGDNASHESASTLLTHENAKMLKIMQDEELVNARRLMDACRAQFGIYSFHPKAGRQGFRSPETMDPAQDMDTPLLAAAYPVVVCGVQVFLRGILIGSA